MNTSVDNITFNVSENLWPVTSTTYGERLDLSANNATHVYTIFAYSNLQENWDSYGAKKPSNSAIVKAINFILTELNARYYEVFFTAPTADGDILVELKHNNANLEFIFSGEVEDKIIASCYGEFHAEEALNETTFHSYLKWQLK
jgi:hypothetical protein